MGWNVHTYKHETFAVFNVDVNFKIEFRDRSRVFGFIERRLGANRMLVRVNGFRQELEFPIVCLTQCLNKRIIVEKRKKKPLNRAVCLP